MCIRDRHRAADPQADEHRRVAPRVDDAQVAEGEEDDAQICLLYTSDAADERSSVDLGGRRIIKKKEGWRLMIGRLR